MYKSLFNILFENINSQVIKLKYDKKDIKKFLDLRNETIKDIQSTPLVFFLKEKEKEFLKRKEQIAEYEKKYGKKRSSIFENETLESYINHAKEEYEYILSQEFISDFDIRKILKNDILFAKNIKSKLENIIPKIPNWNNTPIFIIISMPEPDNIKYRESSYSKLLTYYTYMKNEENFDYEKYGSIHIQVGLNESTGFMISVLENGKIEIDDILESYGTNEFEEFFSSNEVAQDYYNLIKYLQNPSLLLNNKSDKAIIVYTARPRKDRQLFINSNNNKIPTGLFVTTNFNSAEGLSYDLQGADNEPRDIYKIKIYEKYLIKTLETYNEKQYQIIGKESFVPIISISMI